MELELEESAGFESETQWDKNILHEQRHLNSDALSRRFVPMTAAYSSLDVRYVGYAQPLETWTLMPTGSL